MVATAAEATKIGAAYSNLAGAGAGIETFAFGGAATAPASLIMAAVGAGAGAVADADAKVIVEVENIGAGTKAGPACSWTCPSLIWDIWSARARGRSARRARTGEVCILFVFEDFLFLIFPDITFCRFLGLFLFRFLFLRPSGYVCKKKNEKCNCIPCLVLFSSERKYNSIIEFPKRVDRTVVDEKAKVLKSVFGGRAWFKYRRTTAKNVVTPPPLAPYSKRDSIPHLHPNFFSGIRHLALFSRFNIYVFSFQPVHPPPLLIAHNDSPSHIPNIRHTQPPCHTEPIPQLMTARSLSSLRTS